MTYFSLLPHQREGVEFLKSSPKHALLYDEQRVGKTGQAIVASGELGLKRILVVTTVAGVGVWKHQWPKWDTWGRTPVIVPWSQISKPKYAKVLAQRYDAIFVDESHYAKNPKAKRTQRMFGRLYGDKILQTGTIAWQTDRIWCLTGTPMSHDPRDLFVALKALFPHVLLGNGVLPDVSTYSRFQQQYCVTVLRKYGRQMVPVVIRGRNTGELNSRIKGLFLRRRQSDVGIQPAWWDQLFFTLTPSEKAFLEREISTAAIRSAIAKGNWAAAERNLAQTRRVTGSFKAHHVIPAAIEFCETYPDEKLVIAYWHEAVGTLLEEGLAKLRPVRVDGSVTGDERSRRVYQFTDDSKARIFLAQIAACGEAIDLSAASEMWFAESVFTPSQMAQMGSRITNLNQPKQCLVRVVTLEDTVDELIQDRLVDLSRSIAHSLGEQYAENFRRY